MHNRNIRLSIICGVLILLFALFVRAAFPLNLLAWASLVVAGLIFGYTYALPGSVSGIEGFWRWPAWTPRDWLLTLGLAAGISIFYRSSLGISWIPFTVYPFVFLSIFIGATEEWVFRGMIQGMAESTVAKFSIALSALSFAGYKTLLFLLPHPNNETSLLILFSTTLLAGVVLAITRQRSRSIWPALLAHILFDLIVYGDTATAPWWVWGR